MRGRDSRYRYYVSQALLQNRKAEAGSIARVPAPETSGYPILMFTPTDAAAASMRQLADDLRTKGAALFTTDLDDTTPNRLAALPPDHPETDPICLVQSFYAMVVRLSAARGTDADQPRHLQKITRTR